MFALTYSLQITCYMQVKSDKGSNNFFHFINQPFHGSNHNNRNFLQTFFIYMPCELTFDP